MTDEDELPECELLDDRAHPLKLRDQAGIKVFVFAVFREIDGNNRAHDCRLDP